MNRHEDKTMTDRNVQIQPWMLTEFTPHCFIAEASTIGLRPGEWPELIATVTGNRQHFRLSQINPSGSRTYHQMNGCCSLIIDND